MSASSEYVEYIRDLLVDLPDLKTRKFFGGVALRSASFIGGGEGICDDIQFAMIQNDVLYFVVDDQTRPKYEAKGMHAFSYNKKSGLVMVRKYYTAPEELFEDEGLMSTWAKEALETAVRLK